MAWLVLLLAVSGTLVPAGAVRASEEEALLPVWDPAGVHNSTTDTCDKFVPNSVFTSYGALPWVSPCKCTEGSVLWGYGPACDPRISNGFDAERVLRENGQDPAACGCESFLMAASADTCGELVPNSVPTSLGAIPWVSSCKCSEGSVLVGHSPACDPRSSNGFDAERTWEDNGQDSGACGCEPFLMVASQHQVVKTSSADTEETLSSDTCNDFVSKSVATFFGALPWLWPCRCGDDSVLWGYGPACDPRRSNGFDAQRLWEENGQELSACGCEPFTLAAGNSPHDTCGELVPNSFPTSFTALPWVSPCKCDKGTVLWGYGPACDPRHTNGFDAEHVWKKNGQDPSACGCEPFAAHVAF